MTSDSKSETGYSALIAELNQVLSAIEREEIGVDDLTASIEKAYGLVKILRSRLGETESRLVEIIAVHEQAGGQIEGQGERTDE